MSALIPVMQKYEALLARAVGSDSAEERRTCATIIVKLINEQKVFVVAELPREAPTYTSPWRPTYRADSAEAPWRPTYRTSDAPKPRTIVSKFDSTCLDCHTEIYAGEECVWVKGRGCWHTWCTP